MNGKIAIDTTEDYVAADSHIFFQLPVVLNLVAWLR